jgi:hypothetical protein
MRSDHDACGLDSGKPSSLRIPSDSVETEASHGSTQRPRGRNSHNGE